MFKFAPIENASQLESDLVKVKISEVPETPLGSKLVPKEFVTFKQYENIAEKIRNFKVREDDVWIIGRYKSGTTWAQEMIWLIVNDFDFDGAKSMDMMYRIPLLEQGGFPVKFEGTSPEDRDQLKSPRVFKTHSSADLMPTDYWRVKPKTIVIFRNVKDVIVSNYHFFKMVDFIENDSLNDFVDRFLGENMFGPPYWESVLDYSQMQNVDHILHVQYEEMIKDLPAVIEKCCKFLGKSIDSVTMEKMTDHLSLKSLKKNKTIQDSIPFVQFPPQYDKNGEIIKIVREGKVGGYKDCLTEEQIKKIDDWTKEKLQGIAYPYEL